MAEPEWDEIKAEYVTGTMSMRELAQKHGVPHTTLSNRAKRGGWTRDRAEHRGSVVQKAAKRAADSKVKKLLGLMDAADGLAEKARAMAVNPDASYTPKEIQQMAKALSDLVAVVRNLYELPTQAEAEAQRIAAARLAMDQRKLDTGSDGGVVIRIDGEAADYGG